MLKQKFFFAAFLAFVILIWVLSQKLILNFYVFYPMALIFGYCFYYCRPRFLFFISCCLILLIYGVTLLEQRTLEMLFFGAGIAVFYAGLVNYHRRWERALEHSSDEEEVARKELEALNQKHLSRLDSLHHLEKQVAGLLDLFEIARDFGESLSFESVADILHKKVMPELPFHEMKLTFFHKMQNPLPPPSNFIINAKGVHHGAAEIAPPDVARFEKIFATKQMLKEDDRWIFPLTITESDINVGMSVEGAQQDDLAKFEVLSAYLTLQVKKVRLYETVKELAIRDGLTGVFVRRHFMERFEEELRRSSKFNLPLAVLMLDIDHFKRYNDDYGHLAGDATLKQVASLLIESVRKVDIVARYGGEEFIIVIPETRKEGAFEAAERIRSSIARYNFKVYQEETRVTVSVGVALYPTDMQERTHASNHSEMAFELIRHADKALYRAKEEGRNRVVLYQDL